jgi:hypothetical protein
MSRVLLMVVVAVMLASACVIPPADAVQIRRLIRDEARAQTRGDTDRLYQLHDPDFRAICSPDQFRALPHEAAAITGVRDIETRGVRGWATIDLATGGSERRSFVKDAGRWYVYADAQACRRGSGFLVAGSWLRARLTAEPGTRNQEHPSAAVTAHG